MCDIKKNDKIYKDIETLSQRDIMELISEAKTEDEKNFYETIGNFFLQKRQRECIERNVF